MKILNRIFIPLALILLVGGAGCILDENDPCYDALERNEQFNWISGLMEDSSGFSNLNDHFGEVSFGLNNPCVGSLITAKFDATFLFKDGKKVMIPVVLLEILHNGEVVRTAKFTKSRSRDRYMMNGVEGLFYEEGEIMVRLTLANSDEGLDLRYLLAARLEVKYWAK